MSSKPLFKNISKRFDKYIVNPIEERKRVVELQENGKKLESFPLSPENVLVMDPSQSTGATYIVLFLKPKDNNYSFRAMGWEAAGYFSKGGINFSSEDKRKLRLYEDKFIIRGVGLREDMGPTMVEVTLEATPRESNDWKQIYI